MRKHILDIKRDQRFFPGTGISVFVGKIENIQPHTHEDTVEILYCLKGYAKLHLAHQEAELSEGEIVTIDLNDVHNIYSTEDNLMLVVDLSICNAEIPYEDLKSTIFSCATHYRNDSNAEKMDTVIDRVLAASYEAGLYWKALEQGQDGAEHIHKLESIRLGLVSYLYENFSWFKLLDLTPDDKKYEMRLKHILSFVNAHCLEKVTVPQMAAYLYLNPTYLSNFLRRTAYTSFTEIIYYYRCLHAQVLLLSTDMSVGDISEACGFSSEKYLFSRYKKWCGTTPHQYRIKFREYVKQPETFEPCSPEWILENIPQYITRKAVEKAIERQ